MDKHPAQHKKLTAPFYPETTGKRAFFANSTVEEKTVSEYTGLNFAELLELNVFDYWRYYHDAIVWNASQTEKGELYLEKAYLYQKNKGAEKADRAALAEFVN